MTFECPILAATRQKKTLSSNPCNDCGKYNDCLDDLTRDMTEEVLKIVGVYLKAVKESAQEYAKVK